MSQRKFQLIGVRKINPVINSRWWSLEPLWPSFTISAWKICSEYLEWLVFLPPVSEQPITNHNAMSSTFRWAWPIFSFMIKQSRGINFISSLTFEEENHLTPKRLCISWVTFTHLGFVSVISDINCKQCVLIWKLTYGGGQQRSYTSNKNQLIYLPFQVPLHPIFVNYFIFAIVSGRGKKLNHTFQFDHWFVELEDKGHLPFYLNWFAWIKLFLNLDKR